MKHKNIRNGLFLLTIILAILGIFAGCGDNQSQKQTAEKQLYTCPMHPDVITDEPGSCPKCGMDLVKVKSDQAVSHESHEGHNHEGHGTAAEESGENQLWTCGMHPEVILDEPGSCPKCGMDLVPVKKSGSDTKQKNGKGKILYWQAPMNPTEIYDKPGKSKMGMDLVPVYEGDSKMGSGGTISIDPATVQNMGVRTAKVTKGDFYKTLRTVGYLTYDERKVLNVNSKINGWIEKLYVDYTGKPVRKGQPLLELYSPELVTTQEEFLLAVKNLQAVKNSNIESIRESAEELLAASRKRLAYWDIPEREIEHLKKTGEVKKTMTLYAPYSGIVVHKNAIEGTHIREGEDLYRIADLSTIWVQASVYDYELPWVKVGQTASMELSYIPGKEFQGKITYIYPYLDEKARDVKIRMEFPNPDLELKPGMYANVTIRTEPVTNTITIPTEAVVRSGKRNLVFVARGDGRFEPREVQIGAEGDNGRIQVLQGLLGNEEVVISAQFLLDSESRLQEAIQKMLSEKKAKK